MSPLLFTIRAGVVLMFTALLVAGVVRRRQVVARLEAFLFAPASALDLGLFRIVAFGLLVYEAMFNQGTVVWFSTLPEELRVAPPGLAWVLPLLPVDPFVVGALQAAFVISSVLASVGLFTRVSSAFAVALGLYVLGVPQLFGKLNHYHHVWWFAAIIAAAPSARALSLDALLRTARLGEASWVEDGQERSCYGLPLRLCWLVVGLIYFFPGLWKAWEVGHLWVAGNHVPLLLHEKWLELGDFEPLFRIDLHPALYRAVGVFTILFELGFVFALFFPRARPFAILSGLMFHLGTKLLMDISFVSLVLAYSMFLDVPRVLRRLGPALERLLPSSAVSTASTASSPRAVEERPTAAALIGASILASMIFCGFSGTDSWPVAVYPRFHYAPSERVELLTLELQAPDGRARPCVDSRLIEQLHSSRWMALMRRVRRAPSPLARRRLVQAVLRAYESNGVELHRGDQLHVYAELVSTSPDQRQHNPLRRRQLDVIEIWSDT